MDIIDDFDSNKKEITNYIEKYGSCREHNYWFFYNQQTNYTKLHFFKSGNAGIISIRYKSGIWEIIGDTLGKAEKRKELFKEILDYVLLTKKDKKMFVFIPEKFFNDMGSILKKSSKYRMTNSPDIYYNPVFDMKKWDEKLKGKEFKKLRNIRSKFLKSHDVKIILSKDIDKKKLIQIVHDWRKNRPKKEMNYYTEMYLNFIKNNFEGTDMARTVVVNNKPCTITAGWKIPNSKNYYSSIGLYNYRYDGLGEVGNIDDLINIKKKKYNFADFGDSTESLLQFKKKFGPESFYKTYWFHIVKR